MKKRVATLAILLITSLSMFGCSKTHNETGADFENSQEETGKESSTSYIGIIDFETLKAVISESHWSGLDAHGNKYVLNMQGGNFSYSVIGQDGENKLEGSYALGTDGIAFFESADLQKQLSELDCEVVMGGTNPYLRINDVYLAKDDLTEYAQQVKNMDLAAEAMKYLSSGHCWIACAEDKAIVIFFDGKELAMRVLTKNGSQISKEALTYDWCINYGNFVLFDISGKQIQDYTWDLEDEGDLKVLKLENSEDNTVFYELECDTIENGEDLATSYLDYQQKPEDVEDITTLLKGYEGVSIVDAFVMAGLDPRIENRAVFAEKFAIENYRGTAAQNLFLLESMGGVIK